ncbi:MAG: GlcG/HbpS family heme-binding protein [Rubrimonas sp.]
MRALRSLIALAALTVGAPIAAYAQPAPLPTRPYLPLEVAETAVRACRALAEARGWNVAVAIRDAGGELLAFARMDGARAMPVQISMLKAETAATTGRSTLDLRHIALIDSDPPHGIERLPGIVVIEGGEPIFTSGRVLVGGIGISGATPAQDGECARAAIAAIADQL